ncbi:MAG: hypothetical protein AN485_22230, partial [Anabaena sp. MDT14b]
MQLQEVPNVAVIVGENAVTLSQLPSVWQDIAKGRANVKLSDPQIYVEMAQLFQYKLQYGDVDLFNERPHLFHLKRSFSELFGQMARETLEFYGHDFMIHNYPNFAEVVRNFESKGSEYSNELKVAHIG